MIFQASLLVGLEIKANADAFQPRALLAPSVRVGWSALFGTETVSMTLIESLVAASRESPSRFPSITKIAQSCVLNAQDVRVREASQHAVDNLHVEVFVHRKTQHCSYLAFSSGQKACANTLLWKTLLVFILDSGTFRFALAQVSINFSAIV